MSGLCWAYEKHTHPQAPLEAKPADIALVFIGGFGDGSTGIVQQLYEICPPLKDGLAEQRAYYHWDSDDMDLPWPRVECILSDIEAFTKLNPDVPLVIVGHSLGAVAAFELAARVPASAAPLYLVTLDPVDRESSRVRPERVSWWGHTFVTFSASKRDFIFSMAGRWGDCPTADVRKNADGRFSNEWGRRYIHDYATDLFLTKGQDEHSLFELLQMQLKLTK